MIFLITASGVCDASLEKQLVSTEHTLNVYGWTYIWSITLWEAEMGGLNRTFGIMVAWAILIES